jgi:hypothetical protein
VWKGETVKRRLLLVGLVIAGIALLSGCDFIDQLLDAISGIGGPGGGGTPAAGSVVSGRLEFHLWGNISESGGSQQGSVGTMFMSGSGSYNAATKTFTATWDGGDFSNTYFEARLNATEEYIEYFYARQTQSNVWGAWTYVHEIRGYNILYSYTDGNSRYFIVDGSDAHVIVDQLQYKAWSTSLGSASAPVYWVNSPGALLGDSSDVIQIRLDY